MNEKFLSRDITIRALSVMLALLMWVYVITEQNPEITKDVTIPVRLASTAFLEKNNMVMISEPGSFKLTLKLKGKNNVLGKLNENTIDAVADLEGHKLKGENYLKININGIPEDVNILMRSPESLKVVLEPKVSVQKSVQVNLMGNPSHGLAAMTPVIAPNDVVMIGAESQINKVKNVRVDVDIASVNSEVKKILPVRVLDENGKDVQNITIQPSNVEVSIPIENTKRVRLEVELSGEPAVGYLVGSVTVNPAEILITGNQQTLQGINSIKTEKIDITGETESITKEVNLVIPEGVEVVNTNTNSKVNIFADIEKIIISEMAISNIEYINLPEDMELSSKQDGMSVTLRGAESLVNNAANTIKFFVDLNNAKEGTNALNVLWEAPQGLEVLNVSPQQAVVVLKKKSIE